MYPLTHKLTPEDVLRLKASLYNGATQESVALDFGIQQSHVSRIVHGKTWGQVPWPDGTLGAANREILQRLRGVSSPSPSNFDGPGGQLPVTSGANVRRVLEGQLEAGLVVPGDLAPLEVTPLRPTPHPEPRIPSTKWMDALDVMREEAARDLETDILKDLLQAGEPGSAKPVVKPTLEAQRKLPWQSIVDIPGTANFKMVKLAEEVPSLRPAVEVVFALLPKELWNSQRAELEVTKVAKMFDLFPKMED